MQNHHNVIIIGSGPAGLTAAIYASRANLKPIVFEGAQPGGQLTITTEVENYPGFTDGIQGPELMDIMRKQAQRFGAECYFQHVLEVDVSARPFKVVTDHDQTHYGDALIIATGASAKLLGVPGEDEYMGHGVSACATCDGFFYKNKEVLVVGGGDTAMEEATYLTRFCSKVTIVHRRDQFRASHIMVDRAKANPKIAFLMNTAIESIIGKDDNGRKSITGANVKNTLTGELSVLNSDGIFMGIGHQPNTAFLKGALESDDAGYLITKSDSTYTNIDGVFACGDVQDKTYRQAVTAAGSGCMAAIDAERWLEGGKDH